MSLICRFLNFNIIGKNWTGSKTVLNFSINEFEAVDQHVMRERYCKTRCNVMKTQINCIFFFNFSLQIRTKVLIIKICEPSSEYNEIKCLEYTKTNKTF